MGVGGRCVNDGMYQYDDIEVLQRGKREVERNAQEVTNFTRLS